MKIIKTQEELEALIVNGDIVIHDDLIIECDINVSANIKACNIKAWDIKAHNINADNIEADCIDAKNIKYYGFCFAYNSIFCDSIHGAKVNSKHFCLDGEIAIKSKKL